MLYAFILVLLTLLVLAALGVPWARGLLFLFVGVPVLLLGAWFLWHQEGIGWWVLAAVAVGISAAWYDARNAALK